MHGGNTSEASVRKVFIFSRTSGVSKIDSENMRVILFTSHIKKLLLLSRYWATAASSVLFLVLDSRQ